MSIRFDRSFVCPVFIGRTEALGAMHALLEDATAGTGRTVLVSGEAGIGKSRLITMLEERAGSAGVLTIAGKCFEADRSIPYAALHDMVQSFAAAHPRSVVEQSAG